MKLQVAHTGNACSTLILTRATICSSVYPTFNSFMTHFDKLLRSSSVIDYYDNDLDEYVEDGFFSVSDYAHIIYSSIAVTEPYLLQAGWKKVGPNIHNRKNDTNCALWYISVPDAFKSVEVWKENKEK
jgi:hypothetical protein